MLYLHLIYVLQYYYFLLKENQIANLLYSCTISNAFYGVLSMSGSFLHILWQMLSLFDFIPPFPVENVAKLHLKVIGI